MRSTVVSLSLWVKTPDAYGIYLDIHKRTNINMFVLMDGLIRLYVHLINSMVINRNRIQV